LVELDDVIDEMVHRVATESLQKLDGAQQQAPRALSVEARQNDQSWMDLDVAEQLTKISTVFCDDGAVFGDAAVTHRMIELAPSADMQWVHDIVPHIGQPLRQAGR
jgi:hypothetical protein